MIVVYSLNSFVISYLLFVIYTLIFIFKKKKYNNKNKNSILQMSEARQKGK